MKRALLILVLLFGACSRSDQPNAAEAEPSSTPTTEGRLTFEAALEEYGLPVLDSFRDLGQTVCKSLHDMPNQFVEDDAENDTARTDATLADLSQTMLLATVLENFGPDADVGANVLRATGKALCPTFRADIESLLEARGL